MKRALNFTSGSAVALVLLIALAAQFISGAPPDREQSAASVAPRGSGRTLVVTSTADSGPGTLRQALLDAQSGDTITFDPAVFPPTSPMIITLTSSLPELSQGNLTIDASNAGVILDGSNIGTTPETLLLDDVSLTLDGGPNLIANGDFTAGLGHWRPWDGAPGTTRSLNSSDFTSSPYSYQWSSVAHAGESYTVYDTTDTSDPFDGWPYNHPFYNGSTVWISATGGSTVELRFWYRHRPVMARLHALFSDGHEEGIGEWWFDWQVDWTEVATSQTLPANAVGVALELRFAHSEFYTSGLSIRSDGNTIWGLQVIHFPGAGIALWHRTRNNTIGGDRGVSAGPLGQGNLISSNGDIGVGLMDASFNTIRGNYIGTDPSGTVALGNRYYGVYMNGASHNQVIDNLISGNGGSGVVLCGTSDTHHNTISGNYVGTDASGMAAIGNGGNGVAIQDGANYNLIGGDAPDECNLISGNGGDGVSILGSGTRSNTVSGNYIGTDASGMAAIGNGGNGVAIQDGANYNLIGGDAPDECNLISGNGGDGVSILGSGTRSNTVSGNYIGTDASGLNVLGNHISGISISGGASYNVIGPDNIIAYNGENGVCVHSRSSLGNTITQNSIHDNVGMGIDLWDGDNTELAAPVIFDFDLGAGTVTGATYANCTVEIFSDSSDEGEVYEGRTTADGLGFFTFNKGTPFTSPRLTATATDAYGNTSEFSAPTSGTRRALILQEGNNLPKTRLRPKRSQELADNRIGSICTPPSCPQDERTVADFAALGVKRIRLSLNELDYDQVEWSKPELYIAPGDDDWITAIASNGITITYVLSFWDKADQAGREHPSYPTFKTEDQIQRYLDYVRFIVRHFKDRARYFAIYNEPENTIEVADYINLARRAVPVIRQEYPEAKIVVGDNGTYGGPCGCNPYGRNYLFSILRSDIMPLVDEVAWHPSHGAAPDCDYYREYYYAYPSLVQEIKDVASTHGFIGEYSGTELQYRNPENYDPGEPCTHSKVVCAKYYIRGIVMHLGMDVSTGVVGTFTHSAYSVSLWPVRNLCTIMAGVRAITIPVELQIEATNVMSYGFSLPNGDRMLALWTNGVAVDDDAGITSTLVLPGFAWHKAVGIDVLHSFAQRMITSSEGDNLVIRNLLVNLTLLN